MSAEDYIFEDPYESYERCVDGEEPLYEMMRRAWLPLRSRVCTKCSLRFESRLPQACPDCGGWTDESSD
jgi:hypothetical protein